jgi:hypothetical protein
MWKDFLDKALSTTSIIDKEVRDFLKD